MKNFILPIFLLLLFIKSSISEGLTKKDLVKMSPQQILNTARNGDAIAQLWLGDAIYNGTFPNWNEFESCEWYYRSALQNNAEAAFKFHEGIGAAKVRKVCQYIQGIGKTNLDSDYWLYKSARLNYGPAQYRLFIESKNKTTKLKWIKKAVENKYIRAIVEYGKIHIDDYLVERNINKAIELFKEASVLETKNGLLKDGLGRYEEPSDFELASIYSNSEYLYLLSNYEYKLSIGELKKMDDWTKMRLKERDYSDFFDMKKAVSFAKKCIEKKVSFVCYRSLINYHSERIFDYIDYDEALFWLEEAEGILKKDRSYHQILFKKGYAYLRWPNVKTDRIKAREYFQRAIKSGKSGLMMPQDQKFYEEMIQQTY